MSSFVLIGFVPDWVRNLLSPLWLVGVGAAAALAVMFVLWILSAIISRLPGVSQLAESSSSRRTMVAVLGAVLSAAMLFLYQSFTASARAVLEVKGIAGSEFLPSFLPLFFLCCTGFGIAYLMVSFLSKRNVNEIPLGITEGVLWPIFLLTVVLAIFGGVGFGIAREPMQILSSLERIPYVGIKELKYKITAAPEGQDPKQQEVSFGVNRNELLSFIVKSSQSLEITTIPESDLSRAPGFEVRGGNEEFRWAKNDEIAQVFPEEHISSLYVRNLGVTEADLSILVSTQPASPEVWTVVTSAIFFLSVFGVYFLLRNAMPKAFAVALATAKSEIAQPLFAILMILGIVSLILFVLVPYNTLGEDIKMLKDTGLVLIMIFGIFLAVWAASTSIAEEIEGRTALTVLSKPIGRRSFIVGKFFGITWAVFLLFLFLSLVFMVLISYKAIYEARENSTDAPTWQTCHLEMMGIVPGLALAFMETALLTAISVAISTRLPMLANFVICLSIYVLGHLTPLIVQSTTKSEAFELVIFVAQFIATLFPVLDHFSIQAAVAGGVPVPSDYLGWAFLYSLMYGMIALFLALFLFEDRDLA